MGVFVGERVERMVALSVGHPSAFRAAGMPQLVRSWYMLLFQFPDVAERWLSDDGWAHFREWGHHPDADGVITDLERGGSLTSGLGWYRANLPASIWVDPPLELPPVQAPAMGVWSSRDVALTEEQMTGSATHCANGLRYERLQGVGHWMQLEAPDQLNALLLDFLSA